jgi:hypothetical protein
MRLIPQQTNKQNIFPLFAIATFSVSALTLLLLLFHSSILKTVSTELPASLVQLIDGKAITVKTQDNLERHPEVIRRFVGETMTLIFTWSEKQSALSTWQDTSSLLTEEIRQTFESEFIQSSGNLINSSNNIESIFIIKQLTQPEKISEGKWQIQISANRILSRNNVQTQNAESFTKRILVKAEDNQIISLPKSPTPLQSAIYRLSEARLRIYKVCEIKDKKCTL